MPECGTNVGNSKCPMPRRLLVYWMRSKVISGGHSPGVLPGLAAARLKGLISLGSGTISFSSGHWEMSVQPHDTFHTGSSVNAAVGQMPCRPTKRVNHYYKRSTYGSVGISPASSASYGSMSNGWVAEENPGRAMSPFGTQCDLLRRRIPYGVTSRTASSLRGRRGCCSFHSAH